MHQRCAGLRLVGTLALVVFTSFAIARVPAAQQANSTADPSPQPTGTGRISVRVVAADNGAAVKRARVSLFGIVAPPPSARQQGPAATLTVTVEGPSGASAGVSPQRDTAAASRTTIRQDAETDDSGTCTFTRLPAATYSVMVMPQGGFVRPTGGLEQVRLEDGQSQTLDVRLARTGAIVGRVLDDTGDPVMHAQVRALRRDPNAGRGRVMMSRGASTDDLGQFRLFDLQPGEYYVTADLTSQMTSSIPAASGARTGLAPTYYPGTPALDGARTVTVRSGEDTGAVEFALVRAPLGRVSGVAYDSRGNPLAQGSGVGASVQLSPRGDFYGAGGRGAPVQPGGRFVIGNVPPGDYYLSATLFGGPGREASREGAFVPVTVNGDDVTVDIHTNTGATVSGTIVVEGEPPATPAPAVILNGLPAPRVLISARPAGSGMQPVASHFGSGPAALREDDTFELTGLRGPVLLAASAGSAVLKAITRGGQDITGQSLELTGTERIDDVVVVLTYETGSLEGVVVDSRGRAPADRIFVLVFPDDPARWFEQSPFVWRVPILTGTALRQAAMQRSQPASAGSTRPLTPAEQALRWTPVEGGFFVPRLLPGRYLVAVPDDPTTSPSFDPESLAKLKARAASVTVRAGERSKVQVPAPPAPAPR